MDVNIINSFVRSTRQVFTDMVHISLSAGKAYRKPQNERFHKSYRLSAVIGLSGSTRGLVVMSMSEQVSLAISSGLIGTQLTKVNAECYDALAELANMIAGGAKKDICSEKPITLTIPKVLLTENVHYPLGMPVLIIPFDTSAGKLILQVAMSKSETGESAAAA